MTSRNKVRFKKAAHIARVIVMLIGAIAGFNATFFVAVALVGKLPWWVAVPVVFVGMVLLASGLGAFVYKLSPPKKWLTISGYGGLLAASPLLVLLVHGSLSAEFYMPGKYGGSTYVSVETLTLFVAPVGLAIAVVSLVVFLFHPKRAGRKRAG